MIDGKNCFDKLAKNNLRKYDDIPKIKTGQGDYYTTVCLLDYPYFGENYKMIAKDLSKQQALDAVEKAIQPSTPSRRSNNVFHEKAKETILDFAHGTVRAL